MEINLITGQYLGVNLTSLKVGEIAIDIEALEGRKPKELIILSFTKPEAIDTVISGLLVTKKALEKSLTKEAS